MSVGAQSFEWDFDDGEEEMISLANPIYTFTAEGIYNVKLKALNNTCFDIYEKNIHVLNQLPANILTNSTELLTVNAFTANNKILLSFKGQKNEELNVVMYDNLGREVIPLNIIPENVMEYTIPYSGIASGVYFIHITGQNFGNQTIKIIIP